MLDPWLGWSIALGGGLATMALRLLPVAILRNRDAQILKDVFERAGFGILGGIVATSGLRAGSGLSEVAGTETGLLLTGLAIAVSALLAGWLRQALLPLAVGVGLAALAFLGG